jgi:imidazolonepropionase-like amidohydrolase
MSRGNLAPRLTMALALVAIAAQLPGAAPEAGTIVQRASTSAHPLGRIVITDVTVVDPSGTRESPRPVTVVIDAGHIIAVGSAPLRSERRHAQVIAGRGRFLIPGLWDMHVHVTDAGEGALGAAVAAGVTGIRDLGGELPTLDTWRREIAAGERVGPLILRAGPVLDANPEAPHRVTVLDSARAVFVVDSLSALGVDCIKVHAMLPRAAFFATVAEAHRRHLPVAAHLTKYVTAAEASVAGVASLEHVAETLLGSAINDPRHPAKTMAEAIAANRGERGDSLFRTFVANGTRFVPTLVAYRAFVNWPGTAPESRARRAAVLDSQIVITGRMHDVGVHLLVGTDFTNSDSGGVRPGDIHDELDYFVRAGLTPIAALACATTEPATFLGMSDSLGTIAPGMRADLVLLEADPRLDIRNVRKIAAVIAGGRLVRAPPDAPSNPRR